MICLSGGQAFSPAQFSDLLRHLACPVQVDQHVLSLQVFQLNDALDFKQIFDDSFLRLSNLLAYEVCFSFI